MKMLVEPFEFDFQDAIPICVHHFGLTDHGYPFGRIVKCLVDVPMNKIFRLVFFNQPLKTLKAPVAGVFRIMNMPWWGMSHHHINPFLPPEFGPQPADHGPHLILGVLIRSPIVPMRTLQTKNI